MFHHIKTLYIQSHWKKAEEVEEVEEEEDTSKPPPSPSPATTIGTVRGTVKLHQPQNDKNDTNNNNISNDNLINFCQNWQTRKTNNFNINYNNNNLNSINTIGKLYNSNKNNNKNTSTSVLIKRQDIGRSNDGNGVAHGIRPTIDFCRFKHKMANTLSVMTNVLRNVVSKQRIRYKEKGFNLDLAYICDNIIAMGYPADNIEKIYRNRLEDVYKFLEENHHDHYKIYNLCLERSYDVNKFHGRVAAYPFEDHNPPTIELIQRFCADVDAWLKLNPNNVAAVHCKAGKGRTGTMICCYLLYSNQQQTADNALAHYGEKRTKDRKGVTIPSQRRYVQYFAKLLRSNLLYERRYLEFFEIRFSEAHLLYSQGNVHCAISALQDSESCLKVLTLQNLTIDFRKSFVLDMRNFGLRVSGDIKVELSHKTSKKKIFHFWFNTFFVGDSAVVEGEGENSKLVYTLNKCEIDDAHKDKEHKLYTEDFKVQLAFYNEGPENQLNRANDNHCTYASSNRHHNSITTAVAAAPALTTTSSIAATTIGSGLFSDLQFIADRKQQQNTNTLLYSAATTALATVGTVGASDGLNVQIKPYSHLNNHHHHHMEDVVERRPTSLINYNNNNNNNSSSPHKYVADKQQQQLYRRSEILSSSTLQQSQQNQQQQQNDLKTLELSSCNNLHYTRQQQHQQADTTQTTLASSLSTTTSSLVGTTTTTIISGTTSLNNHNNSHNNNSSGGHSHSNISNSSNSSFNSHITSVSSSASMASCANIHHNHIDKDNEDNHDHDEDDDIDDDDDDDDEDEDEVEDNEEDWESGESAVVKPLPSTTTTTTTTIRYCKKLVTTSTATTTITFIPTTTTISSTTITTTTAADATAKQKKQLSNLFPSSVSNPQRKQNNCCSSYCKLGDIYFNNDNDNDNGNDVDDGDNIAINLKNIKQHNNYENNDVDVKDDDDADGNNRVKAKLFKFDNIDNNDVKPHYYDDNENAATGGITKEDGIITGITNTTTLAKRSNKKLLTSNLTGRYKFMHLLSSPKAPPKVMTTKHSYFKRKSLKSIPKTTTIIASATPTNTITSSSSNCYNLASAGRSSGGGVGDSGSYNVNDDGDEKIELRTRTISTGSTGGCGGGVKLKMSFTKTNSKLKWTQKFHWLQNYMRSADARADLRKTFAKSTSNQRLNSNSSNSQIKQFNGVTKMSEKTSTASTKSDACHTNVENSDKLVASKTPSVGSLLQDNCFLVNPEISVVINDDEDDDVDNVDDGDDGNNNQQMHEFTAENDFYSSICDNQLSFNNSPCKSPRSLVEDRKLNNLRQQQQQLPQPPTPPPHSQPQQQQKPSFTITSNNNNNNLSNVVVVAARPANKHAIGFNIKTNPSTSTTTTIIGRLTSTDSGSSSSGYATATTNNSGSSIYGTPPTSLDDDHDEIDGPKVNKQSPFVFPNISAEITELAQVLKTPTTTTSTNPTATTTITIANNNSNQNNNSNHEYSLGNGNVKTYHHQNDHNPKQQQQQQNNDNNKDE